MRITNKPRYTLMSSILVMTLSVLFLGIQPSHAAKASLPTADEVPAGKRTKIDGVWRLSGINKRVRIDRGRAIVVDGWKHLFLFDVEPGMVVISDIRPAGANKFTGRDLPLSGDWNATFDKYTWTMDVVVNGAFGETPYRMTRENSGPTPPPVEPEPEVEVEPVARSVYAIRHGNAKRLGCPGSKSHYSTAKGGSCWRCPNGYKRVGLRSWDHPRACAVAGTVTFGKKSPAKYLGKSNKKRCPSGQFHMATKGKDGCFSCPKGYRRDHALGIDSGICFRK